MKVLQVSLKPPYPKVDGGCVAIAAMTESLVQAGHEVKLLTMSTRKHPFEVSKIPTDILRKTKMEAIELDTQIKPLDAFSNLFSSQSYNVQRFHSDRFEKRLIALLQEDSFDVIHLESIFCTPYLKAIRKHSNAKVVVRTHNLEFQIWEQLADQEKNPIKKWYLNLLAARLKNYELDVLQHIDAIVAITADDARSFRQLGISVPIETVPIGIDVSKIKAKPLQANELHLYHLGAMDWLPNLEGINWFLAKIGPAISNELPRIKCSLAGRKMPSDLISRSSGSLTIEGEIPNASEFVSDKNVAIVPLISGSGLRVKIVEALAHGKVVLTTSLGATGIPYENGKNILIANSTDEFVEQLRRLTESPERIVAIGTDARTLAEREFDLPSLSSKLTYFYANL